MAQSVVSDARPGVQSAMNLADADELSTHLAFVQRLARGLLGPDGDDVAQEAMVRAWSRAPRDCGNLRGWLRTVVDHLAHNHRRNASRRRALEQRAQPIQGVPAVDEIVAREEVRARVVAAVLALPETLRDVVLLRYYEGLDSTAIAAIVGAPPSTVRSRLQQGLARLRTRLDDEHGNRAAWATPLATFQHRAPGPAPRDSTALRLAVGWRVATVAVALALLLVPVLLLRGDPAPLPVATTDTATVDGDEAAREDPAAERERVAATAVVEEPADAAAEPHLWGRVVAAASGQPIPGALVQLEHRPADEFSILDRQHADRSEAIGERATDAEGRFTFPVVRARQYRLCVAANGFPRHVETNVTGGSEVMVALRAAAGLRGHVIRSGAGTPLANATLVVQRLGTADVLATTTTAADGTFFVGDLPPVALLVAASAPACVTAHEQIVLHQGEIGSLEFALGKGRTVAGRVRDAATGLPIAGAGISRKWTLQDAVSTDADGRFVLEGLGEIEQLHVRCRGYVAAAALVPTQVEAPNLDFDLVRGATIRGRVVDAAGNGLGAAFVAVARDVRLRSNVIHTAWCTATVAADGRFVVEDVGPDQDLQLTVRCPGYGARTLAPAMAPAPGTVHDVGTIELRQQALLEGVVVDVDGRPIAGADVHLFGRDRDFAASRPGGSEAAPIFPFAHRHTRSAADGAFRIAGLAGGDYELSITQPGKEWSHDQAVAGLQDGELRTDLRLVLDVGRVLSGRVRIPGAGLLPADSRMALVARRDGEELHWAKVERDGRFTFERLPGASYRLSARNVPAGLAMTPVAQVPAGRGDLVLELVQAAVIVGRVVDAQDRPLRGVEVSFWLPGETVAPDHVTNAAGEFRLEVEPTAVGKLSARDPDNMLRQVSRDEVRAGDVGIVLRLP